MIRLSMLLGLVGLVLLTVLVAYFGAGDIERLMARASWGILLASLFHLVPMLANARAWQWLLPVRTRRGRHNPSVLGFYWFVWVREAVNGLLPVARIGGEVASARLMVAHGMSNPVAIATLVADMTLSIASQFIFTLIGLGLLAARTEAGATMLPVALAVVTAAAVLAVLIAVQRFGLFGLLHSLFQTLFGDRWSAIVGDGARLDRWVRLVYRRRRRTVACLLWQLVGWILGSGEIWLALWALGSPVPLLDAVLIEALAQGVSSAAFVVPGAVGVQEGRLSHVRRPGRPQPGYRHRAGAVPPGARPAALRPGPADLARADRLALAAQPAADGGGQPAGGLRRPSRQAPLVARPSTA